MTTTENYVDCRSAKELSKTIIEDVTKVLTRKYEALVDHNRIISAMRSEVFDYFRKIEVENRLKKSGYFSCEMSKHDRWLLGRLEEMHNETTNDNNK